MPEARKALSFGALPIATTIGGAAPDQGTSSVGDMSARDDDDRRLALRRILLLIALFLVIMALPEFYRRLAQILSGAQLTPRLFAHILENTAANTLVLVLSWGLKERTDQRLTSVFAIAGLTHGALAAFVLVTHSVYSNWVLLAAGLVSCGIGTIAVVLNRRFSARHVALVGLTEAAALPFGLSATLLTDPATDLRRFDVILIPSAEELTAPWAAGITRALIAGRRVRHYAEYLEELRGTVSLDHFDVDDIPRAGIASFRTAKRLLDLAVAIILIPLVTPILLLASVAILVTMGRPILFRQERVGQGGTPFVIIKLRTMRDASEETGEATASSDSRITPLGRFLRMTHIDELPQLWHVLIGEMSLVGPRPEWTVLAQRYQENTPAYAYRHLVRPGLSGWAQINSGYASNVEEMWQKLSYDLYYLKNFSIGLDLQILLRTLWVLLTTRGAR